MKILIKFPSRSRPERFFEALDSIINNVADVDNYIIWCTLDLDDTSMMNPEVIKRLHSYDKVVCEWGLSESKINAVNRNVPLDIEWDILVVMSDDMRFIFWGFDQIIRQPFVEQGLDLLVHIPDQDARAALATMYIAGRTFYERFNYIYHPSYKSVWCDNDISDQAKLLNKYYYYDITGVILHLNPAYGHLERDEMFDRQQNDWNEDEANYYKRKALNFPQ